MVGSAEKKMNWTGSKGMKVFRVICELKERQAEGGGRQDVKD